MTQFGRFDDPLKDYSKAVKQIKTLADVRDIQERYALILDDAEPCFERITEDTFAEFKQGLPFCYRDDRMPDEEWLEKYGAIPLPKLFIGLSPFYEFGMPSGFFMGRLIEAGLASIENGRFIYKPEVAGRVDEITS